MRARLFLRLTPLAVAAIAGSLACAPRTARADVKEITIAQQFGVAYLPLIVMRHKKLIERHAEKLGIAGLEVTWSTFGSGADMNVALISGRLDFASGGVAPVLQIWDRTRGNLAVKGVASLGSLPLYLNTVNPKVRTIKDFTSADRIALPAVKVSIQALLLQMAASQAYGEGKQDTLDSLTVGMTHPQAFAALLSGTEITAHFAAAPFQNQQLKDPRVRRVLSSYDVLGGPATLNSLYTTTKFKADNPKVFAAVLASLREAVVLINRDKAWAAGIYIAEEKSKADPGFVLSIISDPEIDFTTTPRGFMKFADFMFKTRRIKEMPASWKDVFFSDLHSEAGS